MGLPAFLYDVTLPALEYHRRTLEWCQIMRAEHPVVYDDDLGIWMVFRYDDGIRVRRDYTTFTSRHMIPAEHEFISITNMDPPQHHQMRSLISQAFSSRTTSGMAPRISGIVDGLLAPAVDRGEMDWVADVANPLPMMVIADMLGLSLESWQQYADWTDAIVNRPEERTEPVTSLLTEFAMAIKEHRQRPREDVLGLLLAAEVDGHRLTEADLIGFCFTLFVAGYITTTNLLGNGALCLLRYPAAMAQLRENPGLLPGAVEEILRYMPPFRASPNNIVEGRTATSDVVLAGQLIREGERVQVNRVSVNFDTAEFADAERFDIMRAPNSHQSFGHGIHFCIGAPLARLEARMALGVLVNRLADVRLAMDGPVPQLDSQLMFGPGRLPLVFRPATR